MAVLIRSSYSIKYIDEEIKKCQLLCANCHVEKTSKDLNWYNSLYELYKNNDPRLVPIIDDIIWLFD